LIAINNSLYPTWFLLGKELSHYSAFIIAPIRITSIILIFNFVIDNNSVIELMQINMLSSFIVMIVSIIFLIRHYRIKIIPPRLKEIKSELLDSFKIYKGIGAITLYTASNNLLLGIITNNTMVGIFNAADKIRLAFQSGVTIIGQSLFPQVSRNIKIKKEKTINELFLFMYVGASLVLLLSIIAYLFSENIIHLIAGENYYPAIKVFKIICFIPFIVFVSNILGIQIMLNLEMTNTFNKIIWCGGILNISLLLILIPIFSVFGAAYSVLITESFVSLTMLFIIYKRRIVTDV
jgi:PST family polysaccharide transporter